MLGHKKFMTDAELFFVSCVLKQLSRKNDFKPPYGIEVLPCIGTAGYVHQLMFAINLTLIECYSRYARG